MSYLRTKKLNAELEIYYQIIFFQLKFLSLKLEIKSMKKLITILFLFVSVYTYAETIPQTQTSTSNNEETIKLLKEDVNRLEKEVNHYSDLIDKQLVLVGIIAGLIGVIVTVVSIVVPFAAARRREINVNDQINDIDLKTKELDKQILEVGKKVKTVEDIEKAVNDIQENVKKAEQEAKDSALKSEINKLLMEAYRGAEIHISIENYSNLINFIKDSKKQTSEQTLFELKLTLANAYLYRGVLYKQIYDYYNALSDFTLAIEENPNLSYFYRARGNLFNDLAGKETDPIKKKEYEEKAKKDKDKAKELEQK